MTKFSKKAVLATAVIAGLVASPIVVAAATGGMGGSFMASMSQDQMGQTGPMMGQAGSMMGNSSNMGQLATMRERLAGLSDEQRALVESRMQEHGIVLPPSADAPTTK